MAFMSMEEKRLNFIEIPKCTVTCHEETKVSSLYPLVTKLYGVPSRDYYLVNNGRKVEGSEIVTGNVYIVARVLGGKGGFGSMLRAIGAQIEKTTNREACRDLSGRRLRDINEEQRLKNWISQQTEREQDAVDRKRSRLEKLCREPKHDFKDDLYEKERSELTEKVSNAVEEGLKKSSASGSTSKRTGGQINDAVKKKKKKMLIDIDDEFSTSDSEVDESSTTVCKQTVK